MSAPVTTSASGGAPVAIPAEASPEEAAAIAAAISVLLASGSPSAAAGPEQPSRWRFSGRWWSKPLPARRERP